MRSPVYVGKGAGAARVARNVRVTDMNVDVPVSEARCIEVVANGLPLWHGAQSSRYMPARLRGPASRNRASARRKRRQTYPELASARRARLVFSSRFSAQVRGLEPSPHLPASRGKKNRKDSCRARQLRKPLSVPAHCLPDCKDPRQLQSQNSRSQPTQPRSGDWWGQGSQGN